MDNILKYSILGLMFLIWIFYQYGGNYQFIKEDGVIYRLNPRTGSVERCFIKTPDYKYEKWQDIAKD